uniref:Integrase catalytic domain-containing protein n=1 Tax=Leptobrachium leishanense TaxID=445787 RepID=A0A8C5PQ64_9ANUR
MTSTRNGGTACNRLSAAGSRDAKPPTRTRSSNCSCWSSSITIHLQRSGIGCETDVPSPCPELPASLMNTRMPGEYLLLTSSPHLPGSILHPSLVPHPPREHPGHRQYTPRKATLRPLPIVGEPFRRVAVDLIGPLAVPSTTGKKYILTVVDYATRYPEAVALRDIHAETVAGALLQIFSRVGFPQEILSDQGTQFTAEVTQQLWRLCGIKPLYSSLYHPQTNGLCERFNGTLKQLLRTFTMSHKDWERHLPHLLFAYREVPQEATGFSPFKLLYGRRVRGPLDLLREHWEGALAEEGTSAIDYVLEFRDRLQELTSLVRDNLKAAQTKQKRWYDRSARDRTFQLGQKVLVALRPVKQNKLQAAWEGPYKVREDLRYHLHRSQMFG